VTVGAKEGVLRLVLRDTSSAVSGATITVPINLLMDADRRRGAVRRALGALLFKLARGIQKLSLFFGGIAGLAFVIAVLMLIFNSKHGAAHYGDMTVRRWLWVSPSMMLGAWLVGFRLLPSLLGRIAVALLPAEERAWHAAAVDVSLETGEPIPSMAQLERERAEYLERERELAEYFAANPEEHSMYTEWSRP
jgi:hypothetical protein